jgi:LPS sulfotransferase NodH
MTNAYLVLGPESSGTRLMTRILLLAGCLGSEEHDQPFDQVLPSAEEWPIVWRRSVPHRREWPDLGLMQRLLVEQGFRVIAIVMARDWHAMAHSQVAVGHVPDIEIALRQIRNAYPYIYRETGFFDVLITYEGLVKRPEETLGWLMPMLGLPVPPVDIYDGNAKWYEMRREGVPGD